MFALINLKRILETDDSLRSYGRIKLDLLICDVRLYPNIDFSFVSDFGHILGIFWAYFVYSSLHCESLEA